MPRVKGGPRAHARHKKMVKRAKGFRGRRKSIFKLAKTGVMRAGVYAYRDRRLKKRSFHQLWILRINAACRPLDIKYSRLMYGLELANIKINRKMLAEIATNHPDVFKVIVEQAKAVLPPAGQAPDMEALKKKLQKKEAAPVDTGETEPVKKPAVKKAPAKKPASKKREA